MSILDPRSPATARHLAVGAAPGTRVPELLERLGVTGPAFADGIALSADSVLGVPPLIDGATVTVGAPGTAADAARGLDGALLELHVVGGPCAGTIHRLPRGHHRVGRAAECTVRLEDADVSRVHAVLDVSAAGVFVRDLGSCNGTFLDGEAVGRDPRKVDLARRLTVGSSTLMVRPAGVSPIGADDGGARPAAVQPDGEGHLRVNRSPRIAAPNERVELHLPSEPRRREQSRLPLVALLLPVLVCAPLAALAHNVMYLAIGLMSPALAVGNAVADRRNSRTTHRKRHREYVASRESVLAELNRALAAERERRHAAAPDAAELLTVASTPSSRLWERRRQDEDFLRLRLGTGTRPASARLLDAEGGPCPVMVEAVPVCVDLDEIGVLGVVGDRGRCLALVRSLLGQAAGWHSPADLQLVVLGGEEWEWTAWLPHLLPQGSDSPVVALVGATDDQVRRRVGELESLIDARRAGALGATHPWRGARTVVLLDGAHHLRSVPGMARVLTDGPAVGVRLLCLDEEPARLPVECRGLVLAKDGDGRRLLVRLPGHEPIDDVIADLVSLRWAHRFARALAPLRDATPVQHAGVVPRSARLLDLLGVDATDPQQLCAAWSRRSGAGHTRAVLGVGAAGAHTIDLAVDGPHILIGGTTGSGKSELLQTLIASLAVANRPDDLVFVLVDYKGGAAFADCARLPHTVGLVTDLDDHLTGRALRSLGAELRRRERAFRDAGATDLHGYRDALARGVPGPDLPRLLLVIDEFRVLAEELPHFIDGLVRLAAVGRSLGVHLVLATQRPGGVISADIKANVNLRIALRVRDRADSDDVIDAPDAVSISARTPGRAFARTGANPLVEIQTARVTGRQLPVGGRETTVRALAWETIGDPIPAPEEQSANASEPTDLTLLVDAVRRASAELAIAPHASPWLAPLPPVVTLDDLDAAAAHPGGDLLERCGEGPVGPDAVPFALLDLPSRQRQAVLTWDLAEDANLAIAGSGRAGRTSVLRALAASIARRHNPSMVHLFALDGSAGTLTSLQELPHTGAVIRRDEVSRARRLVSRLSAEIARRQRLLAESGLASVAEQRALCAGSAEPPLPYLVLLIDGWEAVTDALEEVDHGRTVEALLQVLRDGPAAGVRAAVTGDRSVLLSRAGAVLPEQLLLRMADSDLLLAGVRAGGFGSEQGAGRAIRARDGAELQVALLAPEVSGPAQLAALGHAAQGARRAWPEPAPAARAMRVEALPRLVAADELAKSVNAAPLAPRWALVGVGGDDADPVGVDLAADGPALVVAGPPGSGRSTALLTAGAWLARRGVPVIPVAPRRSVLSRLREQPGAAGTPAPLGPHEGARLHTLLEEARGAGNPAVVLADDVDLLLDSPAEQVLLQLLAASEATGEHLVLAGATDELASAYRGVAAVARRGGVGVLLNPTSIGDGDLFGVSVPTGQRELWPGRGLLVRRRTAEPVQVAFTA